MRGITLIDIIAQEIWHPCFGKGIKVAENSRIFSHIVVNDLKFFERINDLKFYACM